MTCFMVCNTFGLYSFFADLKLFKKKININGDQGYHTCVGR